MHTNQNRIADCVYVGVTILGFLAVLCVWRAFVFFQVGSESGLAAVFEILASISFAVIFSGIGSLLAFLFRKTPVSLAGICMLARKTNYFIFGFGALYLSFVIIRSYLRSI